MDETLRVDQVRTVLLAMGMAAPRVEEVLQQMREVPLPGALGYSDDELKGVAR